MFDSAAIAAATGGTVHVPGASGPVQTDTRKLTPGAWYLAIAGERFDGHDFVAQAVAAGVAGIVVHRHPATLGDLGRTDDQPGVGVVQVADTTRAFQDLGLAARRRFAGPVIGLSGSSGKTTTRALIALAIQPLGRVHQTVGNLNNHFGVPMTLLACPPDADAMVVEMGTSAPGEIQRLAEIGEPDVRLLVNVGPAHLEELGGLDGVAQEKGALFRTARPDDVVVVNNDDPYLRDMDVPSGARVVRWGQAGDITLDEAELDPDTLATKVVFGTPVGPLSATLPVPGRHLAHNAAGALAVAWALGIDLREAVRHMEGYEPVGMRLRSEALPGGVQALNDAYNANPASMAASLRLLASLPGRRVAVMGDMLELGPDEARWHAETVALAHELGLERIVLVGPRMAAAATDGAEAYATPEAAVAGLAGTLQTGDRVLFKGSRGARVEAVLEGLRKEQS